MPCRPIGEVAAELVRMTERDRKIRLIESLSRGELEGWRDQLKLGARQPYEGELAALAKRARELGMSS